LPPFLLYTYPLRLYDAFLNKKAGKFLLAMKNGMSVEEVASQLHVEVES